MNNKFLVLSMCVSFGTVQGMWRARAMSRLARAGVVPTLCAAVASGHQRSFAMQADDEDEQKKVDRIVMGFDEWHNWVTLGSGRMGYVNANGEIILAKTRAWHFGIQQEELFLRALAAALAVEQEASQSDLQELGSVQPDGPEASNR